jgi:hypothetical protein
MQTDSLNFDILCTVVFPLPKHCTEMLEAGDFLLFFQYFIQHCFICHLSDSTVSEDAGIGPSIVATSALANRRFNHSARSHLHSARSHPHSARSHLRSARSHPHSARSYQRSARSHLRSARSHPIMY